MLDLIPKKQPNMLVVLLLQYRLQFGSTEKETSTDEVSINGTT